MENGSITIILFALRSRPKPNGERKDGRPGSKRDHVYGVQIMSPDIGVQNEIRDCILVNPKLHF
jgi:hypothetical protein